jgi:hypothetical protein
MARLNQVGILESTRSPAHRRRTPKLVLNDQRRKDERRLNQAPKGEKDKA